MNLLLAARLLADPAGFGAAVYVPGGIPRSAWYGLMPVFVGLWAIVLPFVTFRSTEMQSLFYGFVPSLGGLTLGVLVRKFVFWYRNR